MKDDQRLYPRIETSLDTIYFTEMKTDAGSERLYYPGVVTDKSQGGLGIKALNEHDINEHIWLEGIEVSPKPREACIRWISTASEASDEFRMGVEFLTPS